MCAKRWMWTLVAITTVALAGVGTVALAQRSAPRAVQERVSELFPRRDMEIHPERHGEQTIYETGTGTRLEVSFDRRGSVVEVEARVPVGLVPEPAREAARRQLGQARISEAEIVIRDETLLYELEARKRGGGEAEVYVRPDGTVVDSHEQ